ncbi:MAG: class I SAM-dependent methyltransferase [Cyclobacteriaceae bacterium]|nr:class I SAM-dependent methyltransferase [Cyclobacteriaceae bacterium]
MPSFHQVKSFVHHWLYEVDDHSIHSPFFFDLYSKTVRVKRSPLPKIESLRQSLLKNETALAVEDLGSGKAVTKKTLGSIAETSLSPADFSLFYLDLLHYCNAHRVVELGTSLGVNTLYLAQKKDARIFTFEGSHAIANVALTNFEWAEQKNIELIEGNIDSTLPRFLESTAKVDFAFIDANHRQAPTLRYFHQLTRRVTEKSVIVIDDIHRSEEMEKAWLEIRQDTLVYGSVDLFRCGLLFFDPNITKQHFVWSLK